MFSSSRRERKFVQTKNREICNNFSNVENRRRNFKYFLQLRDEKEKSKNIFSSFEMRKRNFANKSHDLRGDQDVKISNFSRREREINLPPFTFLFLFFSVLKTKKYPPSKGVLTSNSKIKIVSWRILSPKCFC